MTTTCFWLFVRCLLQVTSMVQRCSEEWWWSVESLKQKNPMPGPPRPARVPRLEATTKALEVVMRRVWDDPGGCERVGLIS